MALATLDAPRNYQQAPGPKVWNMKYKSAGPTVSDFHRSEAFVKGIRGPVGSAKSSASVVEMLKWATLQPPDQFGNRRTRWACIRNTYPELKSTTIKTFHDWVPEEMCKTRDDAPITRLFRCTLPDGSRIHAEFLFISCDRPADIGKLKSLELSGGWINEASEIAKEVLDMLTTRVTRFPRKADGGPVHPVVIMDTNSMDDDHWWYKLDVERDQEAINAIEETMRSLGIDRPMMEFFTQPPALLKVNGSYQPNPEAENVQNLTLGAGYYLQAIVGKDDNWIDLYILNKYGRIVDGVAVYAGEWKESFHGQRRHLRPIDGADIGIGMDYGLSPAASMCQLAPSGQLLVLAELATLDRSMGLEQFLRDALKPFLINRFGANRNYYIVGDPSGNRRSDSDMGYCFETAELAGFETRGALTNRWFPRRAALSYFLLRQVGGEPAILFDYSLKLIPQGLAGRYHYRRVQVQGERYRLQNEPYKNKWSHICESLQYIAMEFTGIIENNDGEDGEEKVDPWMARMLRGTDLPPWRVRGAR